MDRSFVWQTVGYVSKQSIGMNSFFFLFFLNVLGMNSSKSKKWEMDWLSNEITREQVLSLSRITIWNTDWILV